MVEPPRGAVTFLFTDIEGSTRLLKQLRGGYAEVLGEHQRLLRAAFEAHGGYEVDTQGDSFFVAFASARDAVVAAVEGQLALASHSWPDGVEVRVRMGLHTGQAALTDGRYTGLAVHRAARIGAAGYGGQILVSQATQTLLEDEEEDLHVFLRDLGEQRLKDLDRPVRLYQAGADGLVDEFPPLRERAPQETAASTAAWRRTPVLVAAALLVVLAIAAAAFALTRDSAGGLAGVSVNHVGLIDPATNEIVSEIPVGVRPGPIAAGGSTVWVGNIDDRSLSKIAAAERAVTSTFPLDRRTPSGIAISAAAVWVAHGILGKLSRVDPTFGEATLISVAGDAAFGSPFGSVAAAGGSVWAVYGDSTLARLNAAGRILGQTVVGTQPAGIVSAGNSVWITNSGDSTVQRLHAVTLAELRSFPVATRPIGIAVAADAIWVASSGDDLVIRIDPDSGATVQIPVGNEPTAVAGVAGAVWAANTGDGTVSRIDPATNQVVETIEVGHAPAGLVEADGLVWVTVQAR